MRVGCSHCDTFERFIRDFSKTFAGSGCQHATGENDGAVQAVQGILFGYAALLTADEFHPYRICAGDMSHCSAGVHQHSCLAKEDPDNGASSFGRTTSRRRGSLHERSPMRLIRPTLSACCDESQLLLGITPLLHGDPPIKVFPRQDPHSSVRMYGPAVPRTGMPPSGGYAYLERITSYRLP